MSPWLWAQVSAPQARPAWIPRVLEGWTFLTLAVWQWLGMAMVLAVAAVASVLVQRAVLWVAARLTRLTQTGWDDQLVESGRGPLKLLFFSALVYSGTRLLLLPGPVDGGFEIACRTLLILSLAWFLLRFLRLSSGMMSQRLAPDEGFQVRGVRTHLTVLRSVIEVAIYVVASALVLLQFDIVKNVGVSLLASAGIAGLAIGVAAQKSISNLLAGIQLSITQPVRIGDQVVIEGEWGTIEEITLTYVVVRIWDLRRLVIPVSQFLDKPFQNWTRTSPDLLGSAILFVDFATDLSAIRAELDRILSEEGQGLWDGKVKSVAVTDSGDRVMTVRALVSARDAGTLFDLRCLVREKLLARLARNPEWLPVTRTRTEPPLPPGTPAPAFPGPPSRQP
ncbi:MAG: mechanosensitive ion channel family protein [Myxococcota bacterium]|nr:mechanosensitive ion channel family protein [Myxococcota bacterium]